MKYLSQQSQQARRDDNLERGDLTDQPAGGDTAGQAGLTGSSEYWGSS